jgi:acyl-CoA thioester hydrolase
VAGQGAEVWRGGVNTWDCDEMGHLNVRYYVAMAMEGLAGLAELIGLPGAFRPRANATLVVREHHIRFLREARARAPLHMTCGVLEIGETDARLLQVLTHSLSGEPCATFITRVSHVTADELRAFPWPARVREQAAGLTVELPGFAAPRGVTLGEARTEPSLALADEIDMFRLASGAFGPRDVDVFGRMEPHHFIGRVSDGVPNLIGAFRQTVTDHAVPPPIKVGGAVLEYRVLYLDWPGVGDRFEIRSGVSGVDARTQKITHWMLEPASGRPWGVAEAAVITFDLEKRKLVPISAEAQAVIAPRIKPQLGFA